MKGTRNGILNKVGKLGLAIVTTRALLLAGVGSAAGGNITTTGGVVGGALTLSNAASANLNTTLTGLDLIVSGDLGQSTVSDATGSGAGWNLTVTATTFKNAANKTLATDALTITGVTVVKNAGKNPTNSIGYPVTVPMGANAPTAVKFYSSAANSGMGKFTITPNVSLDVPADTYAGSYSSTITISIVSGP